MAGYSVKELAQLCNKSQTAIKKRLAKMNATKVAGVWQPSQLDCEALFRYYGVDVSIVSQQSQLTCATNETTDKTPKEEKLKEENQEINKELIETLNKTIEVLKDELKEKNKQLEARDKQIDELIQRNKELSNMNSIYGASNIMQLSETQEKVKSDNKEVIAPIDIVENTKKSLFERFKNWFTGNE